MVTLTEHWLLYYFSLNVLLNQFSHREANLLCAHFLSAGICCSCPSHGTFLQDCFWISVSTITFFFLFKVWLNFDFKGTFLYN